MLFPDHLSTARLDLDRPHRDDLPELQAVIADPRVPEEQFPARFRGPAVTEALLNRALDHWQQHGFGPWVIRKDGTLIGRAGLISSEFEGWACVEAKWFLDPDHWGHGYATEAARAAIDCGFEHLGFTEVLAWTMTTNLGSQAVMRRLGFTQIAEFDRAGLPHFAYRLQVSERTADTRG
jgi:ribosomal-protein-alanine N-acetyltransferase